MGTELLYFEMNQLRTSGSNLRLGENNIRQSIYFEYAGFIVVDKIDKSQVWSPLFYKALGYNTNEFKPSFDHFEKITHPSDFVLLDNILNDYNQILNKEFSVKLRFKTINNTYLLFNTSVKIIHEDEYTCY